MPLVLTTDANPGSASWQSAGSLGGSVGVYTIRPAGPADAANNVYTTFVDMYAVASLDPSPVKKVFLDTVGNPSITPSIIPVPAGSGNYDLAGFYFFADPTRLPGDSILGVGDGVTFTNFEGRFDNCTLQYFGDLAPLITIDDGAITLVRTGAFSAFITVGAAPLFSVENGSTLSFVAEDFATVSAGGGGGVFEIEAGSTVQLSATNGASIGTQTLTGAGAASAVVYGGGASISQTHGGFAGALTYSVADYAYDPATPANWNGVAPTDVAAALDRLAAWIQANGGGPLP